MSREQTHTLSDTGTSETSEESLRLRDMQSASPKIAEILSYLANPTSALILSSLIGAEAYPRELALRFGLHESHVVERLKALERLNLVKANWTRLDKHKNTKVYTSNLTEIRIVLNSQGVRVELGEKSGSALQLGMHSLYVEKIPETGLFVGRKKELRALGAKKGGLTIVAGIPGIGKTALIAKHVRMLIEHSHKRVFWHVIRESDSLGYVLSRLASFLESMGYASLSHLMRTGVTERTALIDAALKDVERSNAVIVLDDYHLSRDMGITQFIHALAKSTKTRTLIACRTRPTELYVETDVQDVALEGYSDADVEELFRSGGLDLPTGYVERLNREVKGHPLVFSILVNLAKKEGLSETATRLASLKVQDQVKAWLQSTIHEDELGVLGTLCVFREPVPFEALFAVSSKDVKEEVLAARLAKLVRLGIVNRIGDSFDVHDVVRKAVYSMLANPRFIHLRLATYYETRGDGRSMLEALYHYTLAGDAEGAIRILANPLKIHDEGYVEPLMHLAENLLAKPPVALELDERVRGWLFLARGLGYERLLLDLHLALRLLQDAQRIALAVHDKKLLGYSLLIQTYCQEWMSNYPEAERLSMEGLEAIGKDEEHSEVALWLLDALMTVMARTGKLSAAVNIEGRALKLSQKLGDKRNIIFFTIQLAILHYLKGDYGKALSFLEPLRFETGNKVLTAHYERALGLALSGYQSRIQDAAEHLGKAGVIFAQVGLGYFALRTIMDKVMVLIHLGDASRARKLIKKAAKMAGEGDYKELRVYVWLAKGVLDIMEGKVAEAGRLLSKANELSSANPLLKGRVLFWMGVLMAVRGDLGEAFRCMGEARRAFKRVGAEGRAKQVAKALAFFKNSAQLSSEDVISLAW